MTQGAAGGATQSEADHQDDFPAPAPASAGFDQGGRQRARCALPQALIKVWLQEKLHGDWSERRRQPRYYEFDNGPLTLPVKEVIYVVLVILAVGIWFAQTWWLVSSSQLHGLSLLGFGALGFYGLVSIVQFLRDRAMPLGTLWIEPDRQTNRPARFVALCFGGLFFAIYVLAPHVAHCL